MSKRDSFYYIQLCHYNSVINIYRLYESTVIQVESKKHISYIYIYTHTHLIDIYENTKSYEIYISHISYFIYISHIYSNIYLS